MEYLTDEDYKVAAEHGVSRKLANFRVYGYGGRRKWPKEEAITTPPKGKIRKIAASNGICKQTLDTRIYRLGWPVERAITEPPSKSKPRQKRRY